MAAAICCVGLALWTIILTYLYWAKTEDLKTGGWLTAPHYTMPPLTTLYFSVLYPLPFSIPGHFLLQRCCHNFFAQAAAAGSVFPLRRPCSLSRLSPSAVVHGQDGEAPGQAGIHGSLRNPKLHTIAKSGHENPPHPVPRHTQAPRYQRGSAEGNGDRGSAPSLPGLLRSKMAAVLQGREGTAWGRWGQQARLSADTVLFSLKENNYFLSNPGFQCSETKNSREQRDADNEAVTWKAGAVHAPGDWGLNLRRSEAWGQELKRSQMPLWFPL